VLVTDTSPHAISELRSTFGHFPNVEWSVLDVADPASVHALAGRTRVDSVLSINTLPQEPDDSAAIGGMARLLGPGGKLVLVVPAHPALFCAMDRALGYHRRYRRSDLSALLEQNGFRIRDARYLNWLGAIGWLLNGRGLKRKGVPTRQVRLFDRLLPLLAIERAIRIPFGLSLLVVAEKGE
jgi:hypothetical protein